MGVLETIVVVAMVSAMAGLVAWRCWRAATGRDAGCGVCRLGGYQRGKSTESRISDRGDAERTP